MASASHKVLHELRNFAAMVRRAGIFTKNTIQAVAWLAWSVDSHSLFFGAITFAAAIVLAFVGYGAYYTILDGATAGPFFFPGGNRLR